jgi:GAF domain-containing protein
VIDDRTVQHLRAIITELAGIVLTAPSLRDDLERLIGFSCHVLLHCSAASIALLIDGAPTTVAVSEHLALELDIAQYDNDEGPCLAALNGERIRVDILDADERFPHFAIGATDLRVHSVLSMPIVHHDDVVGTLNFYSHQPDAFDDTADHIARLASAEAAHAITRADVLSAARERREQLQARYDEGILVARAHGVVIAAQRCSTEQARNLLRHTAATTGDTLLTIAQRILDEARHIG